MTHQQYSRFGLWSIFLKTIPVYFVSQNGNRTDVIFGSLSNPIGKYHIASKSIYEKVVHNQRAMKHQARPSAYSNRQTDCGSCQSALNAILTHLLKLISILRYRCMHTKHVYACLCVSIDQRTSWSMHTSTPIKCNFGVNNSNGFCL